jgi:hypothetical protein
MMRLTGSIVGALVTLVLLIAPVSAGREWCARDPIVSLNGTQVQILVAVPEEYVSAVAGAIDVRVAVPSGVIAEVTFLDAGFNEYGEAVSFQRRGGQVASDGTFDAGIRVSLPVDQRALRALNLPNGPIPVQVTIITNDQSTVVEGSSSGIQAEVTVQSSN